MNKRMFWSSLVIGFFMFTAVPPAFGQHLPTLTPPNGESAIQTFGFGFDFTTDLVVTNLAVYIEGFDFDGDYEETVFIAAPPVEISDAWVKHGTPISSGYVSIIVLTTDGIAHELQFSFTGVKDIPHETLPAVGGSGPRVIVVGGDDLYASTNGGLYVSRDNNTWQLDTAGLRGSTVQAITVDSSQNVYAGNDTGIFRQALTGTTWQLLAGSPQNVSYLYEDRNDVLYAAVNGSGPLLLEKSTDRGASWMPDSAGMGAAIVRSLAKDRMSNLYAVTYGFAGSGRVWMQRKGSGWQSIDTGLLGLSADPTLHYIVAVSADTAIHVATKFGLFDSHDGGASWHPVTRGMRASNVYGFYQFPTGRRVATTNLGLYTEEVGDTNWMKRFPASTYLSGIKFFVDNAGHLYAPGDNRTLGYNSIPSIMYVSSDEGTTWGTDSAGLSQFTNGLEYVDESGTEHLATFDYPTMRLFEKLPNGTWQGDSSGYEAMSGDQPYAFVSDHHGLVYLSLTNNSGGRMLRRSISGGSWSDISTSALGGLLYGFAATKDGKLIGGGIGTSVGYYDGNSWTVIPNPAGLTNPSALAFSVDSSNALYAIYGTFDANYYYSPFGVFRTTDLGKNWTRVSDASINFASLVSIGDSTYGLSDRGIYNLSAIPAGVNEAAIRTIDLSIAPNPSTGIVSIEVRDTRSSKIEIYDVLGNCVASLTGSANSEWNGSDAAGRTVASGIYIVRVSSAEQNGQPFVTSKEIVIQR